MKGSGRALRVALLGVLVSALAVLGSTAARPGDVWAAASAAGVSTSSPAAGAGADGAQHTGHGLSHVALQPALSIEQSTEHLQRRAEGSPLGGGPAAIVGLPVLVAAGGRTPTGPPMPDAQDVSGAAQGRAPPAVVSRPPDH